MIKIEYQINGTTKETHYKPNMSIARWYVGTLKQTHRVGKFKLSKV